MLQKMALEEKLLAREFEMRKHADVMAIKQAELQLQNEKMSEEREQANDQADRLKRYGEALRNVLIKQSNDPVEIVAFFRNAEATFE